MSSSSEKAKRYDRQLRLWGEAGQAAMEECTVCLINGTGCGAEALKNLVLPGALSQAGEREVEGGGKGEKVGLRRWGTYCYRLCSTWPEREGGGVMGSGEGGEAAREGRRRREVGFVGLRATEWR